jgi:hypothetical protein
MYSRAESTQIREAFWTAFGRYLSPHLNSEGEKINWVNYHTGYKHLYFRMEADGKSAVISIQITHPDPLMRELFFDKFKSFETIFRQHLEEEWEWAANAVDGQKTIAAISRKLDGVSIYKQEDWPQIISFFKPRIIALDEFWNMVKDAFEELR